MRRNNRTTPHCCVKTFVLSLLCSLLLPCSLHAEEWKYPTSKPSGTYGGGDGSLQSPYKISTAQHLADLAYMVREGVEDYSGKHFVMTNDITLNAGVVNEDCTGCNTGEFKVWKPIGVYGFWSDKGFKGNFNGNSHTISGLFIEDKDNFNGLFGVVKEGMVRNLTIADSYMCASYPFYSSNYYGFITGEATNATILNCHVKNSCIKNTDDSARHKLSAGGLVGHCKKGDIIRKCSFNGNFILQSFDKSQLIEAGGMSGSGSVKLYSCTAKGKFMVKGSPSIRVAGMTHEVEEAYGCVAGMDFDIQTYSDYYTGTFDDNAIVVAGFSHITSGECTQCVTYGTIQVGKDGNPVRVQPLPEAPNYKRFRYNIRIGTFCSEEECNGFVAHNQCAAYTNVKLYLADESKGNAYITSFGLSYSESRRSLLELKNCIVAGKHTIKSTTGICYNPVTLFDYRKSAVREIEKAWEKVKGTRYCTYVNNKKDEDVYFDDGDFKDEKKKYVSITHEVLKGDALLAELNALSEGSNQWGRITTEGDLKGYPMPVICGGSTSTLKGDGSEKTPYLIGSEADLRNFQKKMETENSKDKYYQLTADIDMSGEPIPAIGPQAHPFQGTFDGNGHSINGLVTKDGYLFHYLQGTVKNLTLLDYKGKADKTGIVTSIACFVGGSADGQVSNPGHIKNCYVSGNIEAYRSSYAAVTDVTATGLCLNIYKPSTVENCYFKGNIKVSSKTVDGKIVEPEYPYSTVNTDLRVGGLASTCNNTSTSNHAIKNCYASFTYECLSKESFNNKYEHGLVAGASSSPDELSATNSFFVCQELPTECKYKLQTEYNLKEEFCGKADFDGKENWKEGLYRPVVVGTKYYTVTLPDEARTKTYLDAIPETKPLPNYILNFTPADKAQENDPYLWQLPNLAIYIDNSTTETVIVTDEEGNATTQTITHEDKADYLMGVQLDPNYSFDYRRSENATCTRGAIRYDLEKEEDVDSWHMLCLPGPIYGNMLPEGCELYLGGKLSSNNTMNIIKVDSIPAGTPCLMYVPKNTPVLPIYMIGYIEESPVLAPEGSALKGTFKSTTGSNWCSTVSVNGESAKTLPTAESVSLSPFSAYVESSNDVTLADYLLLDELDPELAELIKGSTSGKTDVYMRRSLSNAGWNTLCLPFMMTAAEIKTTFGEGTAVEELNEVAYDNGTGQYTLKFKSVTDGMAAGKPYLIKPANTGNLYTLQERALSATTTDITKEAGDGTTFTMKASLGMAYLIGDNTTDTDYYFTQGGSTLYRIADGQAVTFRGFRSWFEIKTPVATPEVNMFRLLHDDGTTTDLQLVDKGQTPDTTDSQAYDLAGRPTTVRGKGIYVIGNKVRIVK